MFHHLQYWLKQGLNRTVSARADANTTAENLMRTHGSADAALRALDGVEFDPPRSADFRRDVARALRRRRVSRP